MAKLISEKTLELNITHELLNIADSFWWYLQPIALKRYWSPGFRFPLIEYPRSYSLGLTLDQESKEGWDVCINAPQFIGGPAHALFLQFKAGEHLDFCMNNASIFWGDKNKHNPHIKFSFNNNIAQNQHSLLRNFSNKLPKQNAILYAFPRIVNEAQLIDNIGRLISLTSFFSVKEIDDKAAANNITIKDGVIHEFRADYNIYSRNEINSTPFVVDSLDLIGKTIAEVISLRIYRALFALQQSLKEQDEIDIHGKNITEALIRFIEYLCVYLSIDLQSQLQKFVQYERMYIYLLKVKRPPQKVYSNNSHCEYIFDAIIKKLAAYIVLSEETHFNLNSKLKMPEFDILIRLPEEGLYLKINDQIEDSNLILDNISYSLF